MELNDLVIPEAATKMTQIVTCTVEGILDEEDLRALALGAPALLPTPNVEPDDPSDLKKLREKHHSVARMVASGMSQRLVATITGYTESYISILLNSPAMNELIEMYRIQNGAAAQVITEKLRTVGGKALDRLNDQLDENKLNNQELIATAKLGADRSGHGPSSHKHVVDERHLVDHAEITRLHMEARKGSTGYIVPVQEVRKALEGPKPAEDAE